MLGRISRSCAQTRAHIHADKKRSAYLLAKVCVPIRGNLRESPSAAVNISVEQRVYISLK